MVTERNLLRFEEDVVEVEEEVEVLEQEALLEQSSQVRLVVQMREKERF